jgi:DNA-binding NtrC family response regulator
MVCWAESIGPNTARLFERIMNDGPSLRAPFADIRHGVITVAARTLGLARTTLHAKMKRLGISRVFAKSPFGPQEG